MLYHAAQCVSQLNPQSLGSMLSLYQAFQSTRQFFAQASLSICSGDWLADISFPILRGAIDSVASSKSLVSDAEPLTSLWNPRPTSLALPTLSLPHSSLSVQSSTSRNPSRPWSEKRKRRNSSIILAVIRPANARDQVLDQFIVSSSWYFALIFKRRRFAGFLGWHDVFAVL